MAPSVKRPTLDLSSGVDPRVMSSSPALDSTLGVEPTFFKNVIFNGSFPTKSEVIGAPNL